MSFGATEKRLQTHAVEEQGKIGKEHIERMPYSKVGEPFFFGRLGKFLRRHDGVRSDAGAKKLCIMIVMMIVRTLPYTWRRNHVNAEKRKNGIGNSGFIKNSMVLKIVENDEKP